MLKRLMTLMVISMLTLGAFAQFQEGKGYLGASVTGLNLHYNSANGLNIGIEAKAGYLVADNLMVLGSVSAEHNGSDAVADHFSVGVGGRYYITQNGLYLGLNAKYIHANHNYNDVMPGAEVGYAFFINRSVTIEPAVYYDHSFNDSKISTVGLKVGVGIYLFDD